MITSLYYIWPVVLMLAFGGSFLIFAYKKEIKNFFINLPSSIKKLPNKLKSEFKDFIEYA